MVTKTFDDLGLSPKVLAAIETAGYVTPTPIQAAAIPVALTGQDVLGIAQTGTGKTASFTLPMITRLETGRARARMPRSLILAPTRELAAQVAQSFEKYGINHKLSVALLIGGVSMNDQTKKLDRGVDVLIATPGRMLDHFQRGRLMLMGVEILVIDEADRMLDMGFIPDIEKICKLLPPRRQSLFFSATMPDEITRLVKTFMKDPQRIEVARPATAAQTIKQLFRYCANCTEGEKREILRELIHTQDVKNAIIFCNRKRDVAILHKSLLKHGFNAGALHGDLDQKSRIETLDKFRSGEILLLAASDVAARGLDIPDVSHIFNFDLPWQSDDYIHRIGRTGRAGKEGTSTSLVTTDDFKVLDAIEKMTGSAPVWIGRAPTEEDVTLGHDEGKKRRGGQRGRRSTRSDRSSDRSSGRSRKPRRETAQNSSSTSNRPSTAPAPHEEKSTKSERDIATTPQQRPSEKAKRPKSQQRSVHTQQGEAKSPRPSRRRSPAGKQDKSLKAHSKGFADNVPAFLKRPVRRPAKTATE